MDALVLGIVLVVAPVVAFVGLLIWAAVRDGRDQKRRDRLPH